MLSHHYIVSFFNFFLYIQLCLFLKPNSLYLKRRLSLLFCEFDLILCPLVIFPLLSQLFCNPPLYLHEYSTLRSHLLIFSTFHLLLISLLPIRPLSVFLVILLNILISTVPNTFRVLSGLVSVVHYYWPYKSFIYYNFYFCIDVFISPHFIDQTSCNFVGFIYLTYVLLPCM